MSETLWTRSNGETIAIASMGDHHLLSAIKLMKRNGYISSADWTLYQTDPGPSGERAQDAFEMEKKEVEKMKPSALLDALETEARNRGLRV